MAKKKVTFEEAMTRLEEIVDRLERERSSFGRSSKALSGRLESFGSLQGKTGSSRG